MRLHIPSLRGIEAFMAVVDAGNMRAAANAMSLTVSTISHRVQSLESQLGIPLFDRVGHGLRLTEAGERYRADLLPVLAQLERATARAQGTAAQGKIRVATVPLFYSNWVFPRLDSFLRDFPNARVELLSLDARAAEDADLVIRPIYTQHARAGERKLFGWQGTPICHPDLVAQFDLKEPQDLRRVMLIDLKTPLDLWEAWFAAAGLSYAQFPNRLLVDSQALMYDAVMQKVGVSIATTFFSQHYVGLGLVRPFRLACDFRGGMYINAATREEPAMVQAFREWLMRELELTAQQIAGSGNPQDRRPESPTRP